MTVSAVEYNVAYGNYAIAPLTFIIRDYACGRLSS
jgi:hypothetical protein